MYYFFLQHLIRSKHYRWILFQSSDKHKSLTLLAGFHTYLASSNLTTNEHIKGSYSGKGSSTNFNPYNWGNPISNCAIVMCGPQPPSLIDARGKVTPQFTPVYEDPFKMASSASMAQEKCDPKNIGTLCSLAHSQTQIIIGSAGKKNQINNPENCISPIKKHEHCLEVCELTS